MGKASADPRYNGGYDDGFGEVLDSFPEAGQAERHPWDVWVDGKVRVLRRGRHFDAETAAGMRSTVYAYARRHGLEVRVRLGRPKRLPSGKVVYDERERFLTLQFPQP